MATWLVTGAGGFLGSNLGYWLRERATTVGIARTAPAPGLFDTVVSVDLTDGHAVIAAIGHIRPDVVVHTAAAASHLGCETNPDLAYCMNVEVPATVARAADSVGARLLHISSDAVFDGARGDYRETDPPNPFSVYGETKLLGERAVMEACPSALVARTNFFGWSPSGTRSILEFFVNALELGKPVQGFTDFVVTSIYAQHLAEALFTVASLPVNGVLHVASSDAVSKYDFGTTVARRFGLDASLIKPTQQGIAPDGISRARDISLNTDLLASLLGHLPPTQSAGVDSAYFDRRLSAVFAQKP